MYKKNLFSVLKAIKSHDTFVIGGGGHFGSNTKLYIYLFLCGLLAKLWRKKIIISRVGVIRDALNSNLRRVLMSFLILFSEEVSVRDHYSYEELMKYFKEHSEKIKIEEDFVIQMFKSDPSILPSIAQKEKSVGISLVNEQVNFNKIYEFIKKYLLSGYQIRLYNFYPKAGDKEIIEYFVSKYIPNEQYKSVRIINAEITSRKRLTEILYDIASNEVFLSMRLHPLIIAYYSGTRCIVPLYNYKQRYFYDIHKEDMEAFECGV